MNIYSQNSSPSIHLTDEEALIHDFDHVSLNPEPQTESFCLVMKVLTSKSRKRDWVGLFLCGCISSLLALSLSSLPNLLLMLLGILLRLISPFYDLITLFMRIRVLFDISKPLHRGMNVHFRKLSIIKWLQLLYEGIKNYFYHCGKLDHTFNKCDKFLKHFDDHAYPLSLSYKDALKAPVESVYKKSIFELYNSISLEEYPNHVITSSQSPQDVVDRFLVLSIAYTTLLNVSSPSSCEEMSVGPTQTSLG
ncbi:hypothetical protein G4B88_002813 [Cannabis sativa]|uniref:Uncharacterized protein n=1 Tax=Cannabis sativa TaxID=3483 RepID=A0A7J6HI26_CANSA|nr:hypothetical protein G4B88_002813 [Cannabis sativa]